MEAGEQLQDHGLLLAAVGSGTPAAQHTPACDSSCGIGCC